MAIEPGEPVVPNHVGDGHIVSRGCECETADSAMYFNFCGILKTLWMG
jgi:hypothetical protein